MPMTERRRDHTRSRRGDRRPWTFYVLAGCSHPLRARALRPDDLHLHPVVPGYPRRPGVPDEGACRCTGSSICSRRCGPATSRARSIARSSSRCWSRSSRVVVSFMAGLAFRRRFLGDTVVFYLMIGSLVAPGLVLGLGIGLLFHGSASARAGTPRRSARNCPGRCRSACW